jgi:ribosome production factor 1
MKEPFQMVMICLPIGPSIVFRLSSVKLRKELNFHGAPTGHKPELILKNFNTANGRRVGRFLGSMFNQDPEFRARTVVSFLNSRDYIFVRHHRYVFKDNGKKVGLQEIGPRFTLKVKRIMEGTFQKFSRIEWLGRDDMYVNRKEFYL